MSTIDVIVPCYRYGHFLKQCVESVLTQTGAAVRVLVIDDASPDNTYEVATELARSDSRIVVLRHSLNRGHIASYNEGIEWATADYFLLLSADDWLLPGALARADAVLSRHPDVVLTCGDALVATPNDPAPEPPKQSYTCSYKVISGTEFIRAACVNAASAPLWTPTAIVRTVAQKSVGGYSDSLPHTADLEMWLRLAMKGSVAILNAYQAVYRKHCSNMHHAFAGLANLREHLLAFKSVLEANTLQISNRPQLIQKCHRSLAVGALKAADEALRNSNAAVQGDCIDFATTLYPQVWMSRWWFELCAKKVFGYKPINAVKAFVSPIAKVLR